MAEIAVKIGAGANYEDGDVLDSFNRRCRLLAYAEMICWPRVNGRKVGGQLGTTQPLLEKFYQRTAEHKYERVSKDEIKRINLWTPGEVVFGSALIEDPDRPGHMIYCEVEEHFDFRNDSGKLPLFGREGREIEYGDGSKRDAATVELIWDDIEHDTPLRRVDYNHAMLGEESLPTQITLEIGAEFRERLKKLGRKEPFEVKYFGADRQDHVGIEGDMVTAILGGATAREHLYLTVDEFDDETANELVAPLLDEASLEPEKPVLKKRKHHIDWRAAATASLSASIADIEDRTKRVDVRGAHTFQRANIVLTKSV